MKTFRRIRKQEKREGATMVEFAMVAPVAFLFIFALIEFSRMVMVQHALTNAAREGCRKATLATTQSASDVDSFVRTKLQTSITNASNSGVVQITVTPNNLSELENNTPITVTATTYYSNVSWIPWNSLYFLKNTVVTGSSTMTRE